VEGVQWRVCSGGCAVEGVQRMVLRKRMRLACDDIEEMRLTCDESEEVRPSASDAATSKCCCCSSIST
jgi:hypothetical protein